MPKRFPTPDPEIKRYEDGSYVLRIGDKERSLRTKEWKIALIRKPKLKAKLDETGEMAGKLTCGDVWGDYESERESHLEGKSTHLISGKAERRRKTISPATFKEIKDLGRLHLKPFFEAKRLDKLDEEIWDEYCQMSMVIDLANHRKVFRGFLKWCKRKKYIKYVFDLTIPPVERRERHVLRPHEIRGLFEHANGSLLIFIAMYLFMGMRRKEIMTLRWSRIFFDQAYLMLVKSEVKTRRGRPLPINSFVLEILKDRRAEQINKGLRTDFVFPNRKDANRSGDVSGLKTAWRTCMKRCGFEKSSITPHDLRATFEAYAHKSTAFTDTQKEKFAGAGIDVQKKVYVRFNAEDVRGLEEIVQVEGLGEILKKHRRTGKIRGTPIHETQH